MDYAAVYGELHESGAQKHFAGFTLKRYRDHITPLIAATRPRRMMDYGSGKGYQYLLRRYHTVWAPYMSVDAEPGAELPVCYDLGVRQLRQRECKGEKDCFAWCPRLHPKSKTPCQKVSAFDGVFSTDMMEHIEKGDVRRIIDDALGFVTTEDRPTFAFFSVSCIPADKFLPDGRNVHVTMEPPEWWAPIFTAAFEAVADRPQLHLKVMFETKDQMVTREWARN